jgi:radical SAM superfamily enzyme YgiQ (UPF0313 family)
MSKSSIVTALTLSNIKHNMIEFIKEYGYQEADNKLASLYGKQYIENREELYQWYDFEISGECDNVK